MLPTNDVQRVRYFTARVAARPGRLHDPVHQDAYLRALATLPTVTVHLGHFLTKPMMMPLANPVPDGAKFVEVLRTEGEGLGRNLATYLLADAFRGDTEAFVVVSNDSDLMEPMRIVRHELGRVVGILNPQPSQKRSRALLSCKPTFKADPGRSARGEQVPAGADRLERHDYQAAQLVAAEKAEAPPKRGFAPSNRSGWGKLTIHGCRTRPAQQPASPSPAARHRRRRVTFPHRCRRA
jgi:hypothetical protein